MHHDVETRVLEILTAKLGMRPALSDDLAALNLDSLALAEFSAEIESTYGVRMDDRVFEVTTVGEMVEYVCGLRTRQIPASVSVS
ncbi:MAG: acyl carrier protein [Pirellulales bacterium]